MPFEVTNWPYSPDPRSALFGGVGWDFGAVPPWSWIISTTNATAPWTALNSGILVMSTFDDFVQTDWGGSDVPPSVAATVTRKSDQPPINPPNSLELSVRLLSDPPGREASGVQEFIYPFAVAVFGGFAMIDVATGLPDPNLPDPIQITPAIWNHAPL